MGRMELTEPIDTYGLPIFKATKVVRERVGDEMRILFGHEMFGRTVWTHILIMAADDVLTESGKCQQMAMRPSNQDFILPHH